MSRNSEITIGINIGKASQEDRGITVYTHNILKEFGQIDANFHFVLLHYPSSELKDKLGIENSTLQELPFSDQNSQLLTMFGEQFLNPIQQRKLGLDVVWHPHNRGQFIVPVGYVCTMHDILPITNPELASKYLNTWQKRALYSSRTYAAKNADMIITGSEFSKNEIVDRLDSDPNKIIPIYYGVDKNIFRPNKSKKTIEEIKKAYLLPDRYILTTGSYAPHKNHKTLVDAYNQSSLPERGVGLVMVGPNDATGYKIGYGLVQEQLRSLGIEDKIKMLPSVPIDDLVAIYNGASIFSTASLHEGFGFTPLEAMACEVPVVVSNISSIPEVCGNAALYADPANSAEFAEQFSILIDNKDLQKRLIDRGRVQVDRFNWRATAEKTLEVLEKVAEARR